MVFRAFPYRMTLIAFCMLCMGCDSSTSQRPRGQELRLNLKSDPPTLDPRKATDTTSIAVINLCFEGLTRITPDGKPTLASALSYEVSEDKKHYQFILRPSTWSDGTPVTAQDFVESWKRQLDPGFPCEFANDLYFIQNAELAKAGKCSLDLVGVRARDERTIDIYLEHPVPYLLSSLASHAFFPTPQHIVTQYPQWCDGKYISNGPFYLHKYRPHDELVLHKNAHYWDAPTVKLHTVHLTLIQDESTELTLFENGELDWAGSPLSNLPTEALPSLLEQGGLEQYDMAGTYFYVFNTDRFPFNNQQIRRALAMAICRDEIVENVTLVHQPSAHGLVPPQLWTDPPSYHSMDDLAQARQCFAQGLKELGLTAEQFPPVALSYNTLADHHKIAQAIQQQWNEAFGITITLANKEWKVFLDELRMGQFEVARLGGMASIDDPTTFLNDYRYLASGKNSSQWTSPRYTQLMQKADETSDPKVRQTYLAQAEQILLEEMPIAPIYHYKGAYIKKPYVKGVYISDLNQMDLKWAYVEDND